MTHFGPPYALPRGSDEFRRLCLKLLRRHWQLPQLERFHDPDNRELGIDLLEVSGRARLAAVHCQLRELREPLSAAELRSAVDRAESLTLPIGHFVIATTAWRSRALKRAVFELNQAHRAAGRFTVEVLCWEDCEELLDEYPDVLTEFESTPKRQALTKSESRRHFPPRWPLTAAALDGADELAREIADSVVLIDRRHYQLGRLKLMQIREQSWERLDSDQRLSVLANLARAWLGEGEFRKASMLFIAARSLRPDDEDACTNEILAYELLGEHERACALAETVCARLPRCGRAWALWLNNLPDSAVVADVEKKIPAELTGDAEVATVMARRSIAECDYHRAEWFARKATEALAEESDPWLLLGQAILLCEIEGGTSPAEDRVREAEACFSRAIVLAQEESSVAGELQALLGRAQARIAARDIEGAGRDIENAHSLEREDSNGLCEYGILLRTRGNLDEAVEVFRRAVRIGGRDDAEFHLAVTLRERDALGDLHEAAELLVKAVRNPRSIPSGDYLFAVGCAVDVLSRLGRWHQAEVLLANLPPNRIPIAAMYTLRARVELSRENVAEASRLSDDALVELRPETSADERRNLAALLHDLGRYSEALVLWESLVQMGGNAGDTRRLLECATRLGRDEIVLDVCRKLRGDGTLVDAAIEFELEILERNDPPSAIRLLDEYLAAHPEDRVMRLRRSAIARKIGRNDLAATDPAAMPAAREVLPSLGRIAVQLMRDAGRPNEALAYAYELLRRNPTDPDAHRAVLAALGPFGAMPVVPDFETAQLGCAVCWVEQDSAIERWAILEDAPDADEAADEYGPASPMTKQLRGRKPGDKFQLPEGRFNRRAGIVKRLLSKYAYRFQDCLYGWEVRFPGLPEIEMVESANGAAAWTEIAGDLENVSGSSREETREKAEKVYASTPLPIHAYAERLGVSDLQAVFMLASAPDAIIKCCQGSEDELNAALTSYERTNSIVLDLTALATLCLLGRLNLLATWPRRFVIAQATLHELRRLQYDDSFGRLPAGFSAMLTGDSAGYKPEAQLRGLADSIQSVCAVNDGAVLSTLAPERREKLIRFFGRHGAESIVLASTPGHVLWTDDRVIANLARNEFGVRRVWTQSALMARAQAGSLDRAELATAGTKLAGWGYSFTTPSLEILMSAGAVAGWNPDQFPLRQALEQFATDSVRLPNAVTLAAELIVNLYADSYLRASRTTVTARLLDRLALRPGGREAIEALPRSLPIRFGLDLIGARELSDAIRGWMARHTEEIAA